MGKKQNNKEWGGLLVRTYEHMNTYEQPLCFGMKVAGSNAGEEKRVGYRESGGETIWHRYPTRWNERSGFRSVG